MQDRLSVTDLGAGGTRSEATREPALSGAERVSTSWLAAFGVCSSLTLVFLALSADFWHWFIIPVTLCGILVGADVADWLRGKIDVFDPIGIVGILGLYFFYLAPLLHVYWGYSVAFLDNPADWRPWLGGMALLNVAGLLVYRFVRQLVASHPRPPRRSSTIWRLDEHKLRIVLPIALLVTAGLQIMIYAQFGGVWAFLEAATDPDGRWAALEGMGLIFMVSESFPMLAAIGFLYHARRTGSLQSWLAIALFLLVSLALVLLFGGLRGSRSNSIWTLLIIVTAVHFWIRPVPKKFLMVGLAFVLLFMYLYGFIKGAGAEGLAAFESADERAGLVDATGRSAERMLLSDVSRHDIQALMLYRLYADDVDYQYGMGRTYVGGFATPLPGQLFNRPATKRQEGTLLLYPRGYYIPGEREGSKLHGIAGEAMLNFGPYAVPFAYGVLGLIVGAVRRFTYSLDTTDARLLLAGVGVILSFWLLAGDSDNIAIFLVRHAVVPFLIIWLSISRIEAPKPTFEPGLQSLRR